MAQAQPYYKDDAGSADDAPGKMFIGGLSWETTQDGLRNYFVKYGEIADCVVMRDPATGRSRGFGFITFADPKCCDDVMQSGPHQLDQRTIDPKMAVPRAPEAKGRGVTRTKKVFIGGLPFETTEDQFKEYFSKYGKVEEVVLMRDRVTNKPRGFGFVTFDSEDTVDRLCDVKYVEIGDKQVEIKKAEPKIMSDIRQRPYARGGRGGYPSSFMSPYPPPFSGYPSYRGGRGGAFPPRDYGYPPPPASYYPPPSRGGHPHQFHPYGSRPAPYPEDAGRGYGYDGYGRDYDAYGPPPTDYAPAHGSGGAYPYPRPTSAGSSSYASHSSYAPEPSYAPQSAPAPYGDSYGAGVPMGGHYEQTGSYGPTRGAAGYRTSPY